MKTIADKIVDAEALVSEQRNAINELLKTAEDDGRDLDDAEQAQIDELSGTIERTGGSLSALKKAEAAMAVRTVAQQTAKSQFKTHATPKNEKPGDMFIKMACVNLIAHQRQMSVEAAANEAYRDDARVDAMVKAAVNPATTTTSGWASQLVDTAIDGFMEELRGESVYAKLAAAGVGINFGNSGSVSVPGWGGSGLDLAGSFVSEGSAIPVKKGTLVSKTLNRYKMAVISTFTKELTRVSTPQIEGLIRQKIFADTAQAIDTALLDVAAATAGLRPASILNGAPTQASAGNTLDNILTDLKYLMNTLVNNNAGRDPVLIMHPSRVLSLSLLTNAMGQFVFRGDLSQGQLLGVRLVTSTYVTSTVVAIVDNADFATAFGTPEFEASDVATIVEASDVNPAPLVGPVSGAAGTTPPTTVRSLFQTWTTGLRMVMPLSWTMMRPNVAYLTGVNW